MGLPLSPVKRRSFRTCCIIRSDRLVVPSLRVNETHFSDQVGPRPRPRRNPIRSFMESEETAGTDETPSRAMVLAKLSWYWCALDVCMRSCDADFVARPLQKRHCQLHAHKLESAVELVISQGKNCR
jgi:hypothetical protein